MKRTPARILASLAAGAAVFSTAWAASAQADVEFAPPDVLLLIDSSGSMGLTTVRDPANPKKYAPPQCAPYPNATTVDVYATDFLGDTPADRWSILVDVLTGGIEGHACSAQPRNASDFAREYGLGATSPGPANVEPYDTGYYMPFNRIVAKLGTEACTPAPSWDGDIRTQLKDNAVKWPSNTSGGPVYWRDMSQPFENMAHCSFTPQDSDGLIDRHRQTVRFGLMTFDSKPHWLDGTAKKIGTGVITNTTEAYYLGGVGDTWSFFPNWRTDPSTGYGMGWPGGCDEQLDALLEVGARNPAAPPWEGRLIDFGDPFASPDDIGRNNDRVKQALMAMRPYGATPIAGMLEDARYFLLEDDTKLEQDNIGYFWGGTLDDAVSADIDEGFTGCRQRRVILITDGGPNLDLRPDCAYSINGIPGLCPYRTPAETAEMLADNNVPVSVIGFALSTEGGVSSCGELLQGTDPCAVLTSCADTACASGQCAYGYCIDAPDDETLAACCTIKGIADMGGKNDPSYEGPYFAENRDQLLESLNSILEKEEKGTRTRSQPVFAMGNAQYTGSGQDGFAGAEFLNSFQAASGQLLIGKLERQRYVCEEESANGPLVPVLQTPPDENAGDDFGANLDAFRGQRTVFTVVGEVDTGDGKIHSERSIRPWYDIAAGDDGLGELGVSQETVANTKMVKGQASSFPSLSQVDAKALLGNSTALCAPTTSVPNPTADQCRTRYLSLLLGLSSSDPDIEVYRESALGAIVQAAPVLVGPPEDYLRDESYQFFQRSMAARETVLYAPTTDGQLHAFTISPTTKELNELWTFIPPAVLPRIGSQFPDRFKAVTRDLLDGPIVIEDVAGQPTPVHGRFLRRTAEDAKEPSASTTRWHTILVGSFGSHPGYYALDVTWPDPEADVPTGTGYTAGPRFLWQLTEDVNGQPIFGSRSATPAITTLFFKMPGDSEVAEHAVAILPGGYGGERSDEPEPVTFKQVPMVDDRVKVRTDTWIYTPSTGTENGKRSLGGARSLTIVRLDTGEVIRTFRRGEATSSPEAADLQAPEGLYTNGLVSPAPFDAPVSGRIIAYPNGAGAVADRAYLGDSEGRFWRVDLSSAEPEDWGVSLFHDTYPADGLLSYELADAQPLQTPPILSTDPLGRVTIALSTGEQRDVSKSGEFLVWSLTETKDGVLPKARVNWYLAPNNAENPNSEEADANDPHLDNGERVMGPMSLFDSVLYFSTYDPTDEDPVTCMAGRSYLWGVHYINAGNKADEAADPDSPQLGPMPYLTATAPDDNEFDATLPEIANNLRVSSLGLGTVAFGVGIAAKPACYTTETTAADPFLGYNAHESISSVTPTQFQLVVQTSSGNPGAGAQTSTLRKNLYPPLGGGRIDAWASLLE